MLILKEHGDHSECYRDQVSLEIDTQGCPTVSATRGYVRPSLVVCMNMHTVHEILSHLQASKRWKPIDCVLNERVDGAHQSELKANWVTRGC